MPLRHDPKKCLSGNELDLLLDDGTSLFPIEIKAGQTITSDYFKGITYWNQLSGSQGGMVVYAGRGVQKRSNGTTVVPYTDLSKNPSQT